MSLQEALRQMRLELGITQTDLARKLNKSFISVNRWENGKGFPSRDNARHILNIARVNGVSKECYSYLTETLQPDARRGRSAVVYGFPGIDLDFLFQLADDSTNALYVIEAGTYQLLYANRKAEKCAAQYLFERGGDIRERGLQAQRDKRCFHYFAGLNAPCPFCPLKGVTRDEYLDRMLTIPETGRMLHVHVKLRKMKGRDVYVVYMTDLTEQEAENHALYELTNDIPGGVGIYNVYSDQRIELVFMNQALFQMIGAERKEALLKSGESDLCLVHPEDKQPLYAEIESALYDNRPVDLTLRMRITDGGYHPLRLMGRLIKRDAEKNTFYCQFRPLD